MIDPEETYERIYSNNHLGLRKHRFAFEYPAIEDRLWFDDIHVRDGFFAAFAIDWRKWEYTDRNGDKHCGVTYIMPEYDLLESLWIQDADDDFEYLEQFFPFSGVGRYIDPEKEWNKAIKHNIAK